MVHVKKCPLGKRGEPSKEFMKDGKPQVYCMGWNDSSTDEPLPQCRACLDFVGNDQIEEDIRKAGKA